MHWQDVIRWLTNKRLQLLNAADLSQNTTGPGIVNSMAVNPQNPWHADAVGQCQASQTSRHGALQFLNGSSEGLETTDIAYDGYNK